MVATNELVLIFKKSEFKNLHETDNVKNMLKASQMQIFDDNAKGSVRQRFFEELA